MFKKNLFSELLFWKIFFFYVYCHHKEEKKKVVRI